MGMVLNFFPRETRNASAGAATDLYSPVFDVTQYNKMTLQLSVFSSNPANALWKATVQQSSDPTLGDTSWSTLGSVLLVTASGGTGSGSATFLNPARFIRVKLTIASLAYGTVLCEGIARTG